MTIMVLSGSKRASYITSLVNQDQGGGSKKAGIPPIANIPNSVYIAYEESGNGLLSLVNMRKNRFKTYATQYLPLNITNVHGGRIYK